MAQYPQAQYPQAQYPQGPPPAYPQVTQPVPQYGPAAPPPAGQVVVAQPVATTGTPSNFSEAPMLIQCQFCHASINTSTDRVTGTMTWLVAGGICLLGCWLGCCLIPFCVDPLKDVEHRCPNCKHVVGYHRLIR